MVPPVPFDILIILSLPMKCFTTVVFWTHLSKFSKTIESMATQGRRSGKIQFDHNSRILECDC